MLIFGLLVFLSDGDFLADGTNITPPTVAERLNVDQSIILTTNSMADIVGMLTAVVAGQVNQRIGPSRVAIGRLILTGLGHITAYNTVSVPMYLIAMCFVGDGLSSGSFTGMDTLVAMRFPKRQGQAMSIMAMSPNFGTMLFVPLFNVLVGSTGMPMGSMICGGVAAMVGMIDMAFLRDTPKEQGLYPDDIIKAEFKVSYSSTPPELDNSGWTTGKLLRTKETWLCALSAGFLMLTRVGIMTQLVIHSIEMDIVPDLAASVMNAIIIIGIISAVAFGRILSRLGIRETGVPTGVLCTAAMLFNVSDVIPLVWVSLVVIGFLGAAAPALINFVLDSVFDRVGYAKVGSVVFSLINIIFMHNFAVNGLIKKLFSSLNVTYVVFVGLTFLSIPSTLALQNHKYDRDYMTVHKQ